MTYHHCSWTVPGNERQILTCNSADKYSNCKETDQIYWSADPWGVGVELF